LPETPLAGGGAAAVPCPPKFGLVFVVDYLYSLYDALVNINVPNDKARAVVDAMERDMGTTIATKADLQLLGQEISGMATRADVAKLQQEVALIRKDIEIMPERIAMVTTNITARLGATMAGLTGLLFAAAKLT
jgi:hypothetical protein